MIPSCCNLYLIKVQNIIVLDYCTVFCQYIEVFSQKYFWLTHASVCLFFDNRQCDKMSQKCPFLHFMFWKTGRERKSWIKYLIGCLLNTQSTRPRVNCAEVRCSSSRNSLRGIHSTPVTHSTLGQYWLILGGTRSVEGNIGWYGAVMADTWW